MRKQEVPNAQEVARTSIPIVVNYSARPVEGVEFLGPKGFRQTTIPGLIKASTVVSALALRDKFLNLLGFEQIASFLKDCGPFFSRNLPQTVTIESVSFWQSVMRDWMENRSLDQGKLRELHSVAFQQTDPSGIGVSLPELNALSLFVEGLRFEFSPDSNSLQVSAFSALEAIAATIAAELMIGRQFRRCALPLCNKVFAVSISGGREKLYCSPVHSSQAAVYRGRDKAKAERAAE